MTKQKLTPWFPADVKPVHVGVYERNYGSKKNPDLVYCKWDGKKWMVCSSNINGANKQTCHTLLQSEEWRGIQK